MKPLLIIICSLLVGYTNCAKAEKSQKEASTNPPVEKMLGSPIRPNEKLRISKIYIDTFEYVGYNNDADYFCFIAKKDNKRISLIDNCKKEETPKLNCGDKIVAHWKLDSLWVAGDNNNTLEITVFAQKITKIQDGSVSLFKRQYKKPLKYYYSQEYNFSNSFLDDIYRWVEYYLANSQQELVKQYVTNPPKNGLQYSIEEQEREYYYLIGVSFEFEHHTNTIQWIYISRDLEEMYEYDLPNDELIKFE